MGDIADMILEGLLCQECGTFMEGAEGFPRSCLICRNEQKRAERPPLSLDFSKRSLVPNTLKVVCPICHKHVGVVGLNQHYLSRHPREKSPMQGE